MLVNIETASPPYIVSQTKAANELKKRMNTRPAAIRFIEAAAINSGIEKRHIILPDAEEKTEEYFFRQNGNDHIPDTKQRMIQFEKWAKHLSITAVDKLLKSTGISTQKIDRIITISCTGFYAPGIDYDLMEHFNIPRTARRTNIGFMGCAASVIGFNSVLETLTSSYREKTNILMVSVELCSLHLQLEPTRDNILSNMIFADGAAAVLFSNSPEASSRMELKSVNSILFRRSANLMGWKIGNTGFEMMLSSELPKVILDCAVPEIKNILKKNGLSIEDVSYWALHPGGRAILDSLQNGLELNDEKMIPSREVLRKYGNMSSASVLFVLKEILDGHTNKDALCCVVAFGPGLTMELAILKLL